MDCKTWREMASDYIEGSLEGPAEESMRRHCVACMSCKELESSLRAIHRELNVLPVVDPPMFFRENLISSIERGEAGAKRPIAGAFWLRVYPNVMRLATGGLVVAGVIAAIAATSQYQRLHIASGLIGSTPIGVLRSPAAEEEQPADLLIGHATTVVQPGGTAYDFNMSLANADRGTAVCNLIGDKQLYRFNLASGMAPQTLRIPQSAAQGDTIGLEVTWSAGAGTHTKYLFLPVSRADEASPDNRQTFSLPLLSLIDATRQIAARYGTFITLDDVPPVTANEQILASANNETAEEALMRNLAGRGLQVSASRAGLVVLPAAQPAPSETN